MNKNSLIARAGIGAAGAMLLTGVAGAAIADEVEADDVQVNVEIEALEPVGALTMSVAADSTTLTEVDSGDEEVRQFDGTLPTVTVTDDREEVPTGAYWYVTGQSSAFTSDDATEDLGPDQLGWRPEVVDEEGTGEVAPGGEVVTSFDEPTEGEGESANNVGLVGEELLAIAPNYEDDRTQGEWEASAELFLKTDVDVEPGSYGATLTLTLWEDSFED
ncbi:hypothetical protein V2J56_14385 [Georgenia sp. MJ206]|uniref:hypothetical protein n=1 Tax=Georgenia wangjunii TaxID=3117730 RepID=UPI002F26B880